MKTVLSTADCKLNKPKRISESSLVDKHAQLSSFDNREARQQKEDQWGGRHMDKLDPGLSTCGIKTGSKPYQSIGTLDHDIIIPPGSEVLRARIHDLCLDDRIGDDLQQKREANIQDISFGGGWDA